MSVQRLLVTGTDEQKLRFHMSVCVYANAIECRGATTLYTVFDSDLDTVLHAARTSKCTVQQRANQEPFWPVVVQGELPAWTKDSPTKETEAA